MATFKQNLTDRIPVGSKVWSKAIGSKDEFEGVVTAHFGFSYHVQDADGNGWHREWNEIKLLDNAEESA